MSAFENDNLKAAREKLRDLTAIACQVLDTESLNLLIFHLDMHVTVATAARAGSSQTIQPAPSKVIPFRPL